MTAPGASRRAQEGRLRAAVGLALYEAKLTRDLERARDAARRRARYRRSQARKGLSRTGRLQGALRAASRACLSRGAVESGADLPRISKAEGWRGARPRRKAATVSRMLAAESCRQEGGPGGRQEGLSAGLPLDQRRRGHSERRQRERRPVATNASDYASTIASSDARTATTSDSSLGPSADAYASPNAEADEGDEDEEAATVAGEEEAEGSEEECAYAGTNASTNANPDAGTAVRADASSDASTYAYASPQADEDEEDEEATTAAADEEAKEAEVESAYAGILASAYASTSATSDTRTAKTSDASSDTSDVDNRPSDTLIVFDWDDTLLCTSATKAHSWTDVQLHQLERIGEDILRSSMQLGETIIITNGIQSWVQNSAGRYLPGLLPTLNSMTVLSARAMYEDRAPGDPHAWKKHAFTELLAERQDRVGFHENRLNLIVIGDSRAEIDAAKYATKLCGGHRPLLKTIKFKKCPTVHDLLGQLLQLAQELDHIVQETATAHRGMEQDLPEHIDHLGNWASGWRCVERKQEKPRAAARSWRTLPSVGTWLRPLPRAPAAPAAAAESDSEPAALGAP